MSDEDIEQRITAKCAEIRAEVEERFGPNPPLEAHVEVLTVLVAGLLVGKDMEREEMKERIEKAREMRDRLKKP
jgi:hypothetical protein